MDELRDRLLRKGDYVYGSFLKPELVDGYINGVNPGDRADVLGRFPFSESSVDEAVDLSEVGSRTWRRLSINDRATAIRRFRDQVAREQEKLSTLITRETGKPIWEARLEVVAAIRAIDLFLDDGLTLIAPRVIDEAGARSDRIPRGTVAAISPYCFPVLISTQHAVAALLAGNTVVVKPSKFTPGVAQLLAELWDRCKLPRGVYNMVQGPGTVVGQRLVLHPGIHALLFAGSYPTAAAIRQVTIERPELPTAMQCGGKGIALVLDDADLDQAVYEVMVGAFLTAGQRHNSTGRVLVTDAVYEDFLLRLLRATARLQIGYGTDPHTFMGPLISENLRARYRRFARRLSAAGHQAVMEAGSEATDRRGFYVRPAIYRIHWENGQPFLGEEPPGPLLLVYRVKNWEEGAALHNQAVFRLATSVFTKVDGPVLPELRDRLRTGALNVNRGTIGASLRLPSVGVGRSSNGAPTGLELLSLLTQPRSQLIESRAFTGANALPGTNWNAATSVSAVIEPDEPSDVTGPMDEDLSSDLELTAD